MLEGMEVLEGDHLEDQENMERSSTSGCGRLRKRGRTSTGSTKMEEDHHKQGRWTLNEEESARQ